MRPLILASASPRRKQWLESLSIPFEVVTPDIDETPDESEDPADLVLRLAKGKAGLISAANPGRWVLAADTTVAVDHHTLNKPVDVEDAVRMLMLIQGRRHEVHTGMCLQRDGDVHALVDTAEVFLRPISEAQARWYVASGEPMDKAGSYAAQGIAALFIERIEGSFATVMGLPVERLSALLRELGLLEAWIGMPD
ncbi:MAG: septum formation protein Maf [Acidobacteriota bacterium]|nr:septum formation protein Maf [Acidobacteriota bacterium]